MHLGLLRFIMFSMRYKILKRNFFQQSSFHTKQYNIEKKIAEVGFYSTEIFGAKFLFKVFLSLSTLIVTEWKNWCSEVFDISKATIPDTCWAMSSVTTNIVIPFTNQKPPLKRAVEERKCCSSIEFTQQIFQDLYLWLLKSMHLHLCIVRVFQISSQICLQWLWNEHELIKSETKIVTIFSRM